MRIEWLWISLHRASLFIAVGAVSLTGHGFDSTRFVQAGKGRGVGEEAGAGDGRGRSATRVPRTVAGRVELDESEAGGG